MAVCVASVNKQLLTCGNWWYALVFQQSSGRFVQTSRPDGWWAMGLHDGVCVWLKPTFFPYQEMEVSKQHVSS